MIYRQGDRGDCMFVVQSGEVEVVRRSGEQECSLALLGPGSFFGELALFHGEIRPATARAREESYVFTIERNGLLRRIHEDPSIALQLILELARRMASLEEALVRGAPQSQGPASTPA
jgi:CRP-like cAMP-binding protein